jgi:hypothetical protein
VKRQGKNRAFLIVTYLASVQRLRGKSFDKAGITPGRKQMEKRDYDIKRKKFAWHARVGMVL